jgi:hypothetical protein
VIEYGKQNNNGLVQNIRGFGGSVPCRLAVVWPFGRCGIGHYSSSFNGNNKSQVMCLIFWISNGKQNKIMGVDNMAKKSRGGRMTAAKNRAKSGAKTGGRPGGIGMVKDRPMGKRIMKT